MELYQLQSFVVVASERNLTRSARRLNISQSALSTQIKLLEEELVVKLFQRSPKGMVLTENGRLLLTHAQETLAAAESMKQKAFILNGIVAGNITIGLNTDPQFLQVGRLNKQLSRHFPDLNVIRIIWDRPFFHVFCYYCHEDTFLFAFFTG